jgi:hypothetical protein
LPGLTEVEVVGRIDSVNGGIRSTFSTVPDQPVSKFQLTLKGGGKGLLVNSTNICKTNAPAIVSFVGQNGKAETQKPHLRNGCAKQKRRRRAGRHSRHRPLAHARRAG